MLKDYFLIPLKEIKRRRLRSFLTLIGIIIGIAAIVSLVSLGQGLQNAIESQLLSLGQDKLFITAKGSQLTAGLPTEAVIITNKDLEKVKDKVKEMKELYKEKVKQPVILGYGKRAFYKIVKEQTKTKKYGYNLKWTSEYQPEWERKYKIYKKKGIADKNLVRYDDETEKNVKRWLKIGRKNTRKFDNEGVAMAVHDDEEVLISLINSNMTLLVRDKAFAKVMKQLFEDSYKNAEVIK